MVAPVLRKLIMDREPQKVLAWADKVAQWPVKRVIPSHYENDVKVANGKEFRQAFRFLEAPRAVPLPVVTDGPEPTERDLALLTAVSEVFTKLGVVAKSQVKKAVKRLYA